MKTKDRKELLKAVLQGDKATVDRLTKVEPIKIEFTDYAKQREALLKFGLSENEVNEYMAKQPSHEEIKNEIATFLNNLENGK